MNLLKYLISKKIYLFIFLLAAFFIFTPFNSTKASSEDFNLFCGPNSSNTYCAGTVTMNKIDYVPGEAGTVDLVMTQGSNPSQVVFNTNQTGNGNNGLRYNFTAPASSSFICLNMPVQYTWTQYGSIYTGITNIPYSVNDPYGTSCVNTGGGGNPNPGGGAGNDHCPPVSVSLSANPSSVAWGASTNLIFSSSGAATDGCSLVYDPGGEKEQYLSSETGGSLVVIPQYEDLPNKYTFSCSGRVLSTKEQNKKFAQANDYLDQLKNFFASIPKALASFEVPCDTPQTAAISINVPVVAGNPPTVDLQAPSQGPNGPWSLNLNNNSSVTLGLRVVASNSRSCSLTLTKPDNSVSSIPCTIQNPWYDFQESYSSPGTYIYKVTSEGSTSTATEIEKVIVSTPASFPDLIITGWTGPTNVTISPGNTTFTLSAMVKNQGVVSTGQGFYNFFQWSNTNPVTNLSAIITDVPAGQGGISMVTLNAGVQAPMSLDNFSFPAAGTYYVRACADKKWNGDGGVIFEGDNEGNNCGDWTPITYGPASGPDLVVVNGSVTTNPASGIIAGNSVTLKANIINQGKVNITAPTYTHFKNLFEISDMDPNGPGGLSKIPKPSFLSMLISKAFASGTLPDPPVNQTIIYLPTGFTELPVNQNISTPISTSHIFTNNGIYYLRACADLSDKFDIVGVIDEKIEGNNCSNWVPITVGSVNIPGQCATVPNNGTIHYNCSRGSSTNQQSLPTKWTWNCVGSPATPANTVSCSELKNIMTGTLTPAKPSCMILSGQSNCSINFSWTVTNREKTTTYIVTPPPPSPYNLVHSSTLTSEVKVPLVVKYNSETFYLVNNLKNLAQSTVTSYCEPGSIWDTISGKCKSNNLPDLTAGVISPTLVSTMDTITFSTTITNQGNVSTGGSFFNLFQTVDKLPPSGIPDDNDVSDALGTTSISPSLGAGVSKNISASSQYITPNNPGTIYVRACADKKDKADTNGNISESNEKNNCGPWTLVTIVDQAIDGVCASTHYYCAPGNSTNNVAGSPPNNPWTWTCEGIGGGKDAQCREPYGDDCPTGLTNYPACDVCINNADNPPICDHFGDKKCPPGLTNYPACDVCINNADNPPICDHFGKCPTGTVGIPPTNCMCLNFADNPPTCDHFGDCPSSTVGTPPKCTCKNNASNPPLCKKAPTYTER